MRYQPHIDGLRTVAVLPVVLFHVDAALVPGGFTGVDIFFVISGFLITSLIVGEIASGRFSILGFYKRRALRILPAYLAMIAAVIVLGWLFLFPDEVRAFGRTLTTASLFVSNIYFWRTSGYFEPEAEASPLLHTWTLGVEEQFYLVLPVFLILVWRLLGGRFAAAIAVVTVLSFALSVWGVRSHGTAAFYLLPSRAWEFGLGALVAVGAASGGGAKKAPGGRMRGVLAIAGAASILIGFTVLDGRAPFPGMNALWPAVGAVLIIAFAEGTPVGALLSTRPMVAIGRISYSVYLWHWPLIVFWHFEAPPVPDRAGQAILIGLSLILGALSYRFIEEPFRHGLGLREQPARRVNVAALVSLAVAAGAGVLVSSNADRWGALSPEVREIADYIDYRSHIRIHPCLIHANVPGGANAYDPETCLAPGDGKPTILVMGDSFSEHLLYALEATYPEINIQAAASTGCVPVLGLKGNWHCPKVLRPAIEEHVPSADIDAIILAARWEPDDIDRLRETVEYLAAYADEVVVLGPAPEYVENFPRLLARMARDGVSLDTLERFLDPEVRELDRRMQGSDWGPARYISLYDLVCPSSCRLTAGDGIPFQADYGHFTYDAALEIARELALGELVSDS